MTAGERALQAEIGIPSPPPRGQPGCRAGAAYRASRSNAAGRPPSLRRPPVPRPLGPGVWPVGCPEGGTVGPTGGGSSQQGAGRGGPNQSDRPQRSGCQGTDPRRAGEAGRGGSCSRHSPAAGFSPPRPRPPPSGEPLGFTPTPPHPTPSPGHTA